MTDAIAVQGTSSLVKYGISEEILALQAEQGPVEGYVREPYIVLASSNVDEMKEGKIGINHFFIRNAPSGELIDLGESFDAWIGPYRYRAMDLKHKPTIVNFDRKSPTYAQIANMAATTRGKGGLSEYLEGPEVLMWIPKAEIWASLYLSSVSFKNEMPTFEALRFKWAVVTHKPLVSANGIKYKGVTATLSMVEGVLPETGDDLTLRLKTYLQPRSLHYPTHATPNATAVNPADAPTR